MGRTPYRGVGFTHSLEVRLTEVMWRQLQHVKVGRGYDRKPISTFVREAIAEKLLREGPRVGGSDG